MSEGTAPRRLAAPTRPLDITASCPKCGCGIIGTAHEPERKVMVMATVLWVVPEQMKRTCTRCGYSWQERPLDAPAPESAT